MNTSFSNPGAGIRIKLWIKERRRIARERLSTRLAQYRGSVEPRGEPLDRPPESILVSRLNKRLGNTLFMTPLIRSLAAAFPGAAIDVPVLDAGHRCLLAGLPNVREVFHVSRKPAGLLSFVLRMRCRQYDLAIDPSLNAVSNRICMSLCRARYKLGFASPEQWLHLTHAVALPAHEAHQARQAVYLLEQGIPGIGAKVFDKLEVRPSEEAKAAAGKVLARALDGRKDEPVIGFFSNATGNKRFPPEWWRSWTAAIRGATLIQIVPPGATEPLVAGTAWASLAELDRLAALMALFDLFVAADSGPMHLAAASGTPTIGLFRSTDPGDYAPLGRDCLALTLDPEADPSSAERVAARTLEHLDTSIQKFEAT